MTTKALSAERPVVATENHWRDVADKYLAEMAGLRAHIAALEADNAAGVEQVRGLLAVLWGPDFERRPAEIAAQRALAQPHPGAALLEQHEKALVRARNEGRQQAFEVAEACRVERRALREGIEETDANATQRLGWLACKESEAERIAVAITRLMEEEPEQ